MLRAEIERRPLLVLALGLILGLTLVRFPANLLFLIPAALIVRELRGRVMFVGGLIAGAILAPGPPPTMLKESRFIDADFTVSSMPSIQAKGQFCEIERGGAKFAFFYDEPQSLCPGSAIHVVGLAEPPSAGFENVYASQGWIGEVRPETVNLVREGPWIQRLGCSWRDRFMRFAQGNLSPPAAAATVGMCFNVRGLLSGETLEQLKRTNTIHVVIASGLQVVVIALALLWLLQWLPVPRGAQIGLAACILGLYAVATGLHPPVVRAVIMALLAHSAYLVRREPDWLTALAASSLVYLLWKPATVFEMGFQFSCIAVLFIAIFRDHVRWEAGLDAWAYRTLRRSLRTAIVAFVVMTPFLAWQFGYFSLVSIPANLLIVLAAPPMVILAMLSFPIAALWPAAGAALVHPVEWLSRYIYAVLATLGGDGATVQVPPFSAYWLALFYGLLILLWRPYVRPV